MRIIGGQLKSRQFNPPQNIPTRPTTDFAKEGLFNMLNNNFDFEAVKFLDLFGGTGSISYEMSSRGCTDIAIVEQFPKCANFIKKTAKEFGFTGMRVFPMDVFKYMQHCTEQYDLIFAGPPYPLPNLPEIPDLIFHYKLLKDDGWFIMEHNPNHNFEQHPNFFKFKNYGTTIFAIFTNK